MALTHFNFSDRAPCNPFSFTYSSYIISYHGFNCFVHFHQILLTIFCTQTGADSVDFIISAWYNKIAPI